MTEHNDDLLAAEYALGLLDDAEAKAFEQRLSNEPELKAACLHWYEEFASLYSQTEEVAPPTRLKANIQDRLFGDKQLAPEKPKRSFWLWPANLVSGLLLATLIGFIYQQSQQTLFEPTYTDKTKEVRSWKRKMAFDKKRLIPSVAVYVGLNTDFVNDIYKTQKMTPKFGILLQNNLSEDLNVITNLYYDKMGTDFTEFSYIVTATQNFSDRWSAFIENQGIFQKQKTESNIGLGLAYLFSKNLQINTSGRMLFEGKSSGLYAGLGVSYRINKHEDSYKEIDENGNEVKDISSNYGKKKGGFFSNIFNVFKKKDKTDGIRERPTRSRKNISKTTTDHPQTVQTKSTQSINTRSCPTRFLVAIFKPSPYRKSCNHHQAFDPTSVSQCTEEPKVSTAIFTRRWALNLDPKALPEKSLMPSSR